MDRLVTTPLAGVKRASFGGMTARRAIPRPIKRAVRQRCGFGCVLCGVPIYHYDHIEPYESVQEHKAENLTLLCPTHHQEKTSGLVDVGTIRAADAAPFNRRDSNSVTTPHRIPATWHMPTVVLAGNSFTWPGAFTVLQVYGTPLLAFNRDQGGLLLQVRLFDHSDTEVLRVEDGELILSTGSWDVDWQGKTFTIRSGPRKISIEIEFSPPDLITVVRGEVRHRGQSISLSNAALTLNGVASSVSWTGCTFRCPVGINIDAMGIQVGGQLAASAPGHSGSSETGGGPRLGLPRTRGLRRRQENSGG